MLTAALLLAALPASAHEIYPMRPVRAVLRAEPGRTVVDLRADSIFWIAEVVASDSLPATWSDDARLRVEGYVNAHLRLSADGARWRGTLASGVHSQRPWESHEQGELRLRMVYPEAPTGSVIAGEADFFKEYRAELLADAAEEKSREPIPYADAYKTELEVPGRVPARFTLTPDAPGFSVSAADARRTGAALAAEGLAAGFRNAAAAASAWPAALALALGLGRPDRRRAALAAAALAAGAAFSLARPAPPAAAWAAGLAAAAAAGGWLRERAGDAAAALAAAALGAAWSSAAVPWIPGLVPSPSVRAAAWLGALAGGVLLVGLAALGAAAERRRARADSVSHAEELFGRRRRLAATAVLVVCAWGLARSFS